MGPWFDSGRQNLKSDLHGFEHIDPQARVLITVSSNKSNLNQFMYLGPGARYGDSSFLFEEEKKDKLFADDNLPC